MKKIIAVLISLSLLPIAQTQKTYIWWGNLIDGISSEAKKNMTIIVEKIKLLLWKMDIPKQVSVII